LPFSERPRANDGHPPCEPGAACTIEVSTNLADWSVLTNLVNTNGTTEFNADTAPDPQRFFRARLNQ
jgi:hypothetical protein